MRAAALLLVLCACQGNLTPPPTADDAPLTCFPNLDGKIEAAELSPALDRAAHYLVTREHAVDLAGTTDAAGHRTWDLSPSFAGDTRVAIAATPLGAQWYAGSFAGGQFVVPTDSALDGIYHQDEQALWLDGLASSAEAPPEGKTLLVYAAPVAVLRFPLAPGAHWTAVGELPAGSTIRGLPYVGRDSYDVSVDAAGRLGLPAFIVTQALRVRTRVTVTPAIGAATTRRQTSFLFECAGEVARATSHDGETSDDFTTAAELRRLDL